MTEAVDQTEQVQENVELNIQDLGSLKAIIDVAAQRGAFKPGEMAAVGTVYNKLTGFLDNVARHAQASAQE